MRRSSAGLVLLVIAVAAGGCGSSGQGAGSPEAAQTGTASKPATRSKPQAPHRPDLHRIPIIDSFNAKLVNQHVVRIHWKLDRPAALMLALNGVRHGSTKNQTGGGFVIRPGRVDPRHHPANTVGTRKVDFEFGEYNFHGYDRLQFRLRAHTPSGAYDTSHPIVLSR